MNIKKERMKQIFGTFLIMFPIMSVLILLAINFKEQWTLKLDDYLYILVNPFCFSVAWCSVLWFRMKYQIVELDCNADEKLKYFILNSKVKKISTSENAEVYSIKNKQSFVPVKFSVTRQKENKLLNAPKVLIKEIFENVV